MYIVTGGAGFIGSAIVEEINRREPNKQVVVSDWLESDERWKNLNGRTVANIIDPKDLFSFMDDHHVDAVIHMGAISDTTEKNGDEIIAKNLGYTMDLFEQCALSQPTKFIYASSASTYGNGEHGFDDKEELDYLSKLSPTNLYGFSKNMVDKAIASHADSLDKPHQCVGLKFFNVYGPNEYHKGHMASVVGKWVEQINETGEVQLFKSHKEGYEHGHQKRDFIYVKDVARAVYWFIENSDVSGLFNMGTGNAATWVDVATAVFDALGKEPNIKFIDMPEKYRQHYQYFTEATMDKFQTAVSTAGDKPFTFAPVSEGVKDYVQNYLVKENKYL